MRLEDMEATNKLENEMIEDKLNEGVKGIEFLFLNINEDDMRMYPRLLKLAKVYNDHKKLYAFVIDSLKMNSDEFYDKYQVNFWVARNMNIQNLADEYKTFDDIKKRKALKMLVEAISK